jgi:hypothetical protein
VEVPVLVPLSFAPSLRPSFPSFLPPSLPPSLPISSSPPLLPCPSRLFVPSSALVLHLPPPLPPSLPPSLSGQISQALLGSKLDVLTLDGMVELTVPAGIQHDTMLVMRGRGVRELQVKGRAGGRGEEVVGGGEDGISGNRGGDSEFESTSLRLSLPPSRPPFLPPAVRDPDGATRSSTSRSRFPRR